MKESINHLSIYKIDEELISKMTKIKQVIPVLRIRSHLILELNDFLYSLHSKIMSCGFSLTDSAEVIVRYILDLFPSAPVRRAIEAYQNDKNFGRKKVIRRGKCPNCGDDDTIIEDLYGVCESCVMKDHQSL